MRRDFELVSLHALAHFAELTRHIIESLVFALTAGVAVAEIHDHVFDLFLNVGNALFPLGGGDLRNFHNSPALC